MITNAPIQQSSVRQKRENENRAARNSAGNSTDFIDGRPHGTAQRHLQLVADNSAQVGQLRSRGGMAQFGSNSHLSLAVQAMANQSAMQKLDDRVSSQAQEVQQHASPQAKSAPEYAPFSGEQVATHEHDGNVPVQKKIEDKTATGQPAQLTGKGIGIGAAIGGAIGALGFLGGPVVGGITTAAGVAIGGAIGHHVSKGPDDFAKFPPNKNIDPDVIGEDGGGIRVVDEEGARPDDVPLIPDYRVAMHRLHDVVLVLESADRSVEKNPSPDTAKLRKKMVEVQKRGKDLAKHHKASMRLLTAATSVEVLKAEYTNGMNLLTAELERHAVEGENVINKHNYLKQGASLKDAGTGLWRTKWLAVKNAVDTALTSLWNGWRSTLKTKAKGNVSGGLDQAAWGRLIDAEKWAIYYGGSLAKGYKGPPKQNTRFLESEFDVDANMDAPAVAKYLITEKHNTVDRGQLSPKNAAETGVGDMDKAMDKEVKKELLKAGAAPNAEGVDKIVSEEFETRVNAPENLGGAATDEVQRSIDEQAVRDTLTGLRATNVEKLAEIHGALDAEGLCENGSLVSRVLTAEEIETVRGAIDA